MAKRNKCLVADFESINKEDDCRIWAWGCAEIGKPNTFQYGNEMYQFMESYVYE